MEFAPSPHHPSARTVQGSHGLLKIPQGNLPEPPLPAEELASALATGNRFP